MVHWCEKKKEEVEMMRTDGEKAVRNQTDSFKIIDNQKYVISLLCLLNEMTKLIHRLIT